MPTTIPKDAVAVEPLIGQLFEQAPGFLAILEGPQHVFKFANRSYRHLVGERDVIGKPVREVFPELSGFGFFALLDQVLVSKQPYVGRRVPLRLRRANEKATYDELFIDFVYQAVLGPDGAAHGIFCQGHDVTDLVHTERRLVATANELALERQIFDTALSFSNDFNYIFDTAGRFTYVNKPLLALWGMTLDQALGKTFFELPYEAGLAHRLHAEIASVVETAAQVRGETHYRSPLGTDGWYEYIFNPVCDTSGKVICVAGSTRDITLRIEQERRLAALMDSERAARAEAERAGQVKDEFLATLSHELRTPLNSIMGWAQLLHSGRLSTEKAREAVERIVHNGNAQAQLISDLLDMNAIASAKLRLQPQRLALRKPLFAALDAVRPDAAQKGVVLVEPPADSEIQIDCDPDRVQQVFWNLLANAIKFTPAGGKVAVAVEPDHEREQVRIGIADSGCGIEPSFVPHLFERFTQADGSPTRHYGGLGLGLSICKTLVEMHLGQIQAHSDGPGRGSTFVVMLPTSAAIAPDAAASTWGESVSMGLPPPEEAPALQGLRVLVVDDDAEGRSFVLRLLREYGAVVTASGSADDALQAVANSSFSLMICDVGMPGKDGYTLMREVRSSPQPTVRSVRAVALTAFARREEEGVALNAGFDAYLSKPAEPAAIIRTCLRVLANRSSAQRAADAH